MTEAVVGLIGALDTKGREYDYLREQIERAGGRAMIIDIGVLGEPTIDPDISRTVVARAGGGDLSDLRKRAHRAESMTVMARGASELVAERVSRGELAAVLAIGGSNAGYVMATISEALPVGFPKLLVSTIAAGDTTAYVRSTDLTLMYPVVDINGLNRLTRPILNNAAGAAVGMAIASSSVAKETSDAPLVAISMFGVTTACGAAVASGLDAEGIESLTFHATGVGGRTLEALVRSGYLQAVADLTTTELADDLVGGVCTAGPDRLTAAAEMGIPHVVSVGALDMVNFGARQTIPPRFDDRLFFEHNPAVTLMRTSQAECAELGRRLAERVNAATGKVAVLLPLNGLSQLSMPGAPFHDPAADNALFVAIKAGIRSDVPVYEFDSGINDPVIAQTAVSLISEWLKESNE